MLLVGEDGEEDVLADDGGLVEGGRSRTCTRTRDDWGGM
jgi:hypothetical protein